MDGWGGGLCSDQALGTRVVSGSPGVNTQPRCCRLCSEATTRTVCSTGPKASWNHRTSDILRASLTSCRGQTETGEPQRTGQRPQDGAPGMRGSGRPALPCTRGTTAELVGVDGTQESVASLPPPPGQLGRTPAPASAALPDCRGLQPTLSATHTLRSVVRPVHRCARGPGFKASSASLTHSFYTLAS